VASIRRRRDAAAVGKAVAAASARAVQRHLVLNDLPAAIADRLSFENAAPRRFRSDNLAPEIRRELEDLWDGIVADIYDEVAGVRRTKAFGRESVLRALNRVSVRLLQAERVVIFTAVHHPIKAKRDAKHIAVAALGGGASAAVEELAGFGTAGTAATIAIASAVAGEVFETYVAASARVQQFRNQRWPADPNAILIDLAEAAGYGESVDRRATTVLGREAAAFLGDALIKRTATRFSRGMIPLVGIAVGAGFSAHNISKVQNLPLRPPSKEAVEGLIRDLINDPDVYQQERERFLALGEGDSDDRDDEESAED
jgi:hypothetical protein